MAFDRNKNYFIECGNDTDMVLDFLIKEGGINFYGGYNKVKTGLERLKNICLKHNDNLGGILLLREWGYHHQSMLWTASSNVNNGHLEREYQPLVRVKVDIVKRVKLKKVTL